MVKKIYNITIVNKTTKKENECDCYIAKSDNLYSVLISDPKKSLFYRDVLK